MHFFTLVVSWEETRRRCESDPTRGQLRPGTPWLKERHKDLISSLPFLRKVGVCVDINNLRAEKVAETIADKVLSPID